MIINNQHMRTLFIIIGIIAAVAIIVLSASRDRDNVAINKAIIMPVSPEFRWTQVAPPGSGTHQHEWKPGTYPSAIAPVHAFNDELWMIGQKKAWSSEDGIKWQDYDKHDWGERISMAQVFFKDKLWVTGGMDYATNTFLNEVWSSADGKAWTRTLDHAQWSPRKGHSLVVFKDMLWLFGGEVSVDKDRAPNAYVNDIWSSVDGIHWNSVSGNAPWQMRGNPRVAVFKNALWLVGGQGHSDIWRSEDGRNWKQMKSDVPWKGRYDYGVIVYDNLLWVFGGRAGNPRNAHHDVWFSIDGLDWRLQTEAAPWTARAGNNSVVFKDKLWLYGGKHTGHKDSFSGDIWVMERGVTP